MSDVAHSRIVESSMLEAAFALVNRIDEGVGVLSAPGVPVNVRSGGGATG